MKNLWFIICNQGLQKIDNRSIHFVVVDILSLIISNDKNMKIIDKCTENTDIVDANFNS